MLTNASRIASNPWIIPSEPFGGQHEANIDPLLQAGETLK
jgi:hypothetical protein